MYKIYTRTVCRPPGCIKQFLLAGTGFSGIDPALKRKIIMRVHITAFLLFAVLLQVSASGLAQRLTLVQKEATLKQVFSEINKQTGYNVIWSAGQVNGERKVAADFKDVPLLEVLDRCLAGTGLGYTIEDKTVVIRERGPSLLDKLKTALGVPTTVSGTVQDETNQPLSGVTVREKGVDNATVTDAKGHFSLTVPQDKTIVSFSYIGYETQELRAMDIAQGSVIKLKATEINLREVKINKGYYDEKRELSTGDVSVVGSKEIGQQPVSDPILALEGRVPGLNIQQSSGVPGAYSTIQIRGKNSLLNGGDPLYIVDGVPFGSVSLTNSSTGGGALGVPGQTVYNTGGQRGSGGRGMSPFNALNPADIDNITVLKDADATSLYGSRGANGVILITTKKGKAGKTKFDLNMNTGVGQVTRTLDLLNTQQYLEMRHEALKNDGLQPDPNVDFDLTKWDTTRYTNWQKVLIGNTASYTNVNASISGGTTNTQFLIAGGYNNQGTVFPGDYSDRKGSMHVNLNHSSEDQRFHVQFNAMYVNDNSDVPSVDLTSQITLAPDAPAIYDTNGNLNWETYNGAATWKNPLSYTAKRDKSVTNNLISNLDLDYKLFNDLRLSTSFGYNRDQMDQKNLTPGTYYQPPLNNIPAYRGVSFATTASESWIIEPKINYQKKLGDGKLDVLIGTTFQSNTFNSISYSASGFGSDALLSNPLAGSNTSVDGYQNAQYNYTAVYGRINYNWKEKYLLNLTGRRDGSSRFGPGKQFGDFGAIGAGWIFSKEHFVQDNLPFLSFGKLRTSYGTSGNDQIGNYQFLSTYTPYGFSYQNVSGLYPTQLTNPTLAWEVNKKLEGGIELGFLQDRIFFTASYFRNRSSNQLIGYPLPSITGFSAISENLPATVQNTGWEFTLNTTNIKSTDFTWSSSFNLTIPNNKLIAFPDLENSAYSSYYVIGQPLSILNLFHYVNVNSSTGIYQYSGKGGPTDNPSYPSDLIFTNPVTQQWYGGFSNSFHYKGFQLDIFLQFVKQDYGRNYYFANIFSAGVSNLNFPTAVLSRWQKTGDNSNFGKFSTQIANDPNYQLGTSDYGISDASFIRLKNVEMSYQLPGSWKKKMGLTNMRIYVQGQNLLTFTNYIGLDPENQGATVLPPLRMITAGLQVTL